MLPHLSTVDQRWRDRRHSWRHRSAGGFDPRPYAVDPIRLDEAKPFVVQHHYARSFPARGLTFGLSIGSRLVGVAVLSRSLPQVVPSVFPDLTASGEGYELTRFVLLDEVPSNAETWMLGRLFKLCEARGVRGLVSFSDPNPRETPDGLLMPGHVGTIYQAANAVYLGQAAPRSVWVLPDGARFDGQTENKIRRGKRSTGYAIRDLVDRGAPQYDPSDPSRWLDGALSAAGAVRQREASGKHRYAFPLGSARERRALRRAIPARVRPYPKVDDCRQFDLFKL